MRNTIIILTIYAALLQGCSCIPTDTELTTVYKLETILKTPVERQSYLDSLHFVYFENKEINGVNKGTERNTFDAETYIISTTNNPDQCDNRARKRIFITYQNGLKRRIIRDASDPMKVRLEMSAVYQGDEVPEFPVYYYVVVTQ